MERTLVSPSVRLSGSNGEKQAFEFSLLATLPACSEWMMIVEAGSRNPMEVDEFDMFFMEVEKP
jgi:hypothetical protein